MSAATPARSEIRERLVRAGRTGQPSPAGVGWERLAAVAPPPVDPVEARGDWAAVEARLGVELPQDYKRLVETYGWGELCGHVSLRTPFGAHPCNGIDWVHGEVPAPGGLLAWGLTVNADRLCWLTVGEPSSWPVVVLSDVPPRETFEVNATAFLTGWVTGELAVEAFDAPEPELTPWFTTFAPREQRYLSLSASPLPVAERLRILRLALAPTLDRGRCLSDEGEMGQEHFATVQGDWQLTYDWACAHHIRVTYPPDDHALVFARLRAAARLMACEVVAVTTPDGRAADG